MEGNSDKKLRYTLLVTILATISVAGIFWCIQHSYALNVDQSEAEFRSTLTLFQRLDWLYRILFLAPGLFIGAARVRAPILCGVAAYGFGCTLLSLCDGGFSLLANSIRGPDFSLTLGKGLLAAMLHGAVLAALGWLSRYIVLRLIKLRSNV